MTDQPINQSPPTGGGSTGGGSGSAGTSPDVRYVVNGSMLTGAEYQNYLQQKRIADTLEKLVAFLIQKG